MMGSGATTRRSPDFSVLVALGHPDLGSIPARHCAPEVPYEDATSTEPKRLLSNGSPPFRGFPFTEGPIPPDPFGRPSLRNRAQV